MHSVVIGYQPYQQWVEGSIAGSIGALDPVMLAATAPARTVDGTALRLW
jgi:hypothetical protein